MAVSLPILMDVAPFELLFVCLIIHFVSYIVLYLPCIAFAKSLTKVLDWQLLAFMLLGVISGLVGSAFVVVCSKWIHFRRDHASR
jgi:H+/Cl- antiporter ClcA